ncbi:MAG: uncharacterized protein JWP01_3321 [Myxococcales bacterium]|nr:uncharacterized protein [Myxococcales bacterium]
MTTATELRDRLRTLPDVAVPFTPAIEAGIADSVRYLGSDAALRSLEIDTYWPKWHSPWWHMLLLWELGEARQIPEAAVRAMVTGLDALPMHIFPIHPEETPPGLDVFRHSSCHCALGTMAQVLAACGVAVSRELPWVRPWFVRYQMADGGLNCDGDAYLTTECPSSMVGTVSPIEVMLGMSTRTPDENAFLARGTQFLIGRRLTEGSDTMFNAAERVAAATWRSPTFPRFYFYDVLRGLTVLARSIEAAGAALPIEVAAAVVEELVTHAPDGVIRVERQAFSTNMNRVTLPDGTSVREPASRFPLLEATSVLGEPSPALTREWSQTRARWLRLLDDAA